MSKIIYLSLFIVVIGVLSYWFFNSNNLPKKKPIKVTFICSNKKTIQATFYTSNVSLKLSDGRSLTLSRAISASGARYVDPKNHIVFWNKGNTAFITENDSTTYKGCVVKGEDDLVHLKTYRSHFDHIIFRYPEIFKLRHHSVDDTSGWSYASIQKGRLAAQLTTTKLYQPKTNLARATFTVGWNNHPKAIHGCLSITHSPSFHVDTVTHNRITYLRSNYVDAGAGNFYHVVRYRTLRNNRCYSIEEMVHFMNIHNYPANRGISKFDSARVWKALNTVFNTLIFTK